jgi:hypothetical protein
MMRGKASNVVFDIETLAYPLEAFDEQQQSYLLKFAHTDEERTEAILRLNLSPFTARVLAIAMYNPDSSQGKVFYQNPTSGPHQLDDGRVECIPGSEEEILTNFWEAIALFSRYVTFNGRSFDCPFLMLRSSILNVAPSRNLLPYRYSSSEHCDLLEQFTFHGACRKFNLDFYCKAFGILSPKRNGMSGLDIGRLFLEGEYQRIAEYCLDDAKATAELFRRWQEFLEAPDVDRRTVTMRRGS